MVGKPTRLGFRTVTPYLTVTDVDAELAFVQDAMGIQWFMATHTAP